MYQPPHFREDRLEVMHDLIKANPFATLVSTQAGSLAADHIPLNLHPELSANGTLRGHIAKANPLWKKTDAPFEVLVIFQGPHAYITPSWYPSKQEHGRVVPTWNYVTVHAYGTIVFHDDKAWLSDHVAALTFRNENHRAEPWRVSDAPDDFLAGQMKGIVGIEIVISRLEGKWKVSQNRKEQDRLGAKRGLLNEPGEDAVAISDLIGGAET